MIIYDYENTVSIKTGELTAVNPIDLRPGNYSALVRATFGGDLDTDKRAFVQISRGTEVIARHAVEFGSVSSATAYAIFSVAEGDVISFEVYHDFGDEQNVTFSYSARGSGE